VKKVERGGKGTEETGGDCFFYLKTKSCRRERGAGFDFYNRHKREIENEAFVFSIFLKISFLCVCLGF
jgi:hypothetical protein